MSDDTEALEIAALGVRQSDLGQMLLRDDEARTLVRAALDALIAGGRAIAVVEPTDEMIAAGCDALYSKAARQVLMAAELSGDRHAVERTKMRLRWSAMLTAMLKPMSHETALARAFRSARDGSKQSRSDQ